MTCQVCQRDTDTAVCVRCQVKMRDQLREVVALHVAVETELGTLTGGEGSVGSEKTLGVRVSALDFAAGNDVLPVLEAWHKDWRQFFNHAPYGEASSLHLAREGTNVHALMAWVVAYLLVQLDQACREHPAVDEFAAELRTAVAQARVAADRTLPPRWYATCPTDLEDGRCGYRIQIDPGFSIDDRLTCRRCGNDWTISRLLHVISSDDQAEVWLTGIDAALLFGISDRTLQRWAKEKGSCVKRASGMYEVGSVRAYLRGMHTQQAAG